MSETTSDRPEATVAAAGANRGAANTLDGHPNGANRGAANTLDGQPNGANRGAAETSDRHPAGATRSPERLRVLVVDDHDVVQWGFRLMLSQQAWVQSCVAASTGEEAVELALRQRPHVAVVDLFIGSESGAEVSTRIRRAVPQTRVLLFSGAGDISVIAARAAGASGFAHKDWPAAKIAQAVRLVGLGGTVFERGEPVNAALGLSEREREVLGLMSCGLTNPEIAGQLHLSPHTVKEHTSAVYRKLEVRNRTEAVQKAQRLGLLS